MVKTTLALLLTGLLCAGHVHAAGNPDAGKTKAAACGACHGADGNSPAPAFPKLAGQHEAYLFKQMRDIRNGDPAKGGRSVPTMAGQLDPLSDQDLQDIAAYFASQPRSPGAAKKELVELGESVYRAGVRDRGIAACTACHSPTGHGNAPARFPSLSGQHAEYIATALRQFRNEERANDGDTRMMRDVAAHLTDKELEAVSSYAAGLR
jgi:cytochrome c553